MMKISKKELKNRINKALKTINGMINSYNWYTGKTGSLIHRSNINDLQKIADILEDSVI